MVKVFALSLLIPFAVPVIAQTVPAPMKLGKDKQICRRDVATGSIMPTRTCHTKGEWSAIDQQNQGATDAYRNRPQVQAQRSGDL